MTNNTIATGLAALLESGINTALRYDPGTRNRLQKLTGKVLHLHCLQPQFDLYFSVDEQRVTVAARCDKDITATLSGDLRDLFVLLRGDGHSLADSGVRVSGNPALLAEYQQIFRNLDIDWEEPLTAVFGVIPGHQIAGALRSGTTWLSHTGKRLPEIIGEYLSEELRALPSQNEMAVFCQEVDEVAMGVSRAEARLNMLKAAYQQPKY